MALERPGTWNITTGQLTSLQAVLDRIGDVPYRVAEERPSADWSYTVDSYATWYLLGWTPVLFSEDRRFDEYVS